MNSQQLEKIINDLKLHIHTDKAKLFSEFVIERLNQSLIDYYDNLNKSLDKLVNYNDKHTLSISKHINRG